MSDSFNVRIEFEEDNLVGAMKYANKKALRKVGAYVRKTASNQIHKSKQSSIAGSPPNTRRGLLKRSILFSVEESTSSVVIGPAYSFVGISAIAHEFGGVFRHRKYPQRAFMRPALEKSAPYLPKMWQDAIKS